MDLTVISTFRCNSKCQMCYVWQNPTDPKEEVSLETLAKLPGGFDNVNISGGEPTLRKDLCDMVEILHPRARILEISSNGLHPDRLLPIIKRHPDIKVRFSLEGDEATSDAIRGEKDGFATKVDGLRMLREAGGRDLGFAILIQDENVDQIVAVYRFASQEGYELATSTLHNGWQFYKNDNYFYDRIAVARRVEALIEALLRSSKPKDWFRAYLNLGLIEKILGHERLIPCTAARDFAFVDPWSDVWACNVRSDLPMGNLARQSWEEIMEGELARGARRAVAACAQNCWMVTTARTAMRARRVPQLPKLVPILWVLRSKLRILLGQKVPFGTCVDYADVRPSRLVRRESFLQRSVKGRLIRGRVTAKEHYPLASFLNE